MLHLISQFGLMVSAVYLALTIAAAYRNRGSIRYLSGAAAALFLVACVLYLINGIEQGLVVTLAGLLVLLVPAVRIHPRRLIESRQVR